MQLTEEQLDLVVDQSLGNFLCKASQLVREEFCSDCPWVRDGCFPCRTAQTMIIAYQTVLITRQARLN